MKENEIIEKCRFVLYGDLIKRLKVSVREDQSITLQFDIHGLKKYEARRMITGIIAVCRFSFTLNVIHGYHHGTAVKRYLEDEMKNDRVSCKIIPFYNPGETILHVAAA